MTNMEQSAAKPSPKTKPAKLLAADPTAPTELDPASVGTIGPLATSDKAAFQAIDEADTDISRGAIGDVDRSAIITSLSKRALCPDCAHMGGCPRGIPGLIPLPERGGVDAVFGKTKSYYAKLIKGATVVAFKLFSRPGAVRGGTYLDGSSCCAALTRGEIKPDGAENL